MPNLLSQEEISQALEVPDEDLIVQPSQSFLDQALRPFKRIAELQKKQVDESLNQMQSVFTEDNIVTALGKGALGALSFLWSPVDSFAKAIVGEPVEDSLKEFNVPDPVAEFVGETAELATEIIGPGVAMGSIQALRRAPAVSRALQEIRNSAAKEAQVFTKSHYTATYKPEETAKLFDEAGNATLKNVDNVDDLNKVLAANADKYKTQMVGSAYQERDLTRGVVSHVESRRLADELGMTETQLLSRRAGEAYNAHEELSSIDVLRRAANDIKNSAKAFYESNSKDDLRNMIAAISRSSAAQAQTVGVKAEAGRALNILRTVKETTGEIDDLIRVATENIGGDPRKLAEAIMKLETTTQINKAARDATKITFGDKFTEWWINWLLSGPQTHAVNTLSNSLVATWTIPEHLIASGIGKVRGTKDAIQSREAVARLYGFFQGAKDGLRAAKHTFKTETVTDPLTKIDSIRRQAIGGTLGKAVRLPTRALQAEDEFFRAIGYRQELNALAMRSGLSKGLKGKELASHIQGIVSNPTKELVEKAVANARYQTFTQPLGEMGQHLLGIANSHPSVRIIMPFVRTPLNIVKFAAERTPLGFAMKNVRKAIQAGGPEGDLAIARMIFGTSVGAVTAGLAAEGHITGGGPSDPAARRAKFASGWQPYSIKFGDKYYSFSRFEPLGMLLGISADFAEVAAYATQEEADQVAGMIFASVTKNLINKTYLQGLGDAIEAINDPDRYGQAWITRFAGTMVPSLSAQVTRNVDPTMRSNMPENREDPFISTAQTIINQIKSRVPGYSDELPARRNMWGEPITLSTGVAGIIPIYMSVDRNDKASDEVVRLKFRPPIPKKSIQGANLTPKEYERYSELYGKYAKTRVDAMVNNPGWEKAPDWKKEELITKAFRASGDLARKQIKSEYPNIQKRIMDRRVKERAK